MTRRILAGTILLFSRHASAEEKSAWKDAVVLDNAPFGLLPVSAPLDDLIHGSTFKKFVHTVSNDANQFFTIDQGEPLKIIRLFL